MASKTKAHESFWKPTAAELRESVAFLPDVRVLTHPHNHSQKMNLANVATVVS